MTVSFSSNYTKYAANCRTAVELKGHEYCNALLDNEPSHFKTPCCPLWINTLAVALTEMLCVSCSNIIVFLFTARCTLVQSAVLPSHVVCLTVRPSVTLVDCDHIGWNSSKIISPLVSLGCSLFATPTWRVCSKNTPKFGPKVTHPLLIWSLQTFDRKLRPNGYR